MKYVYQTVTAATLQASTETATCMISTINPDREGDRVIPEGGNFANFMKSPVLMWAHGGADGYASVPIGSVTALEVMPGHGVKAEWKWLEGDPFADRIKNAWKQGVVRASSIGFKPITYMKNGMGNDIETWELLELSLCAIPMNPEAVRSLKALGLMGHAEVLRMIDETKALDDEAPLSSGPQPTPSVPPEPLVITEPDDAAKEVTGDEPIMLAEEVDVDTPAVSSIEAVISMTVVGVMQGVLMQMHPVVSATESILASLTPEMLADQMTQEEISQNLCALMDQLHALIDVVYSSAHALEDEDMEEQHGGEYEMTDAMGDQKPKPPYMMSMKSGRVLSAKNEGKIRQAQVHLTDVMKSLYKEMPDDATPAKSLDTVVMNIIEDAVAEPTFTIDPETMRSAIAEAVKSAITVPAMESFQRAINLARGRVH
jgi:HK97 family phage prohead protease